jgi:D-arabinose 1-dehydrogenase-like Zn-dependent alcohol dehydrogenase
MMGGGNSMEMKCIHVVEIGSPNTTKISLREPLDKELLIKVEAAGQCRMDLKLIRVGVGHRDLVLPRIPGEKVEVTALL